LSGTLSRDLTDALSFMMSMRTKANLHQRDHALPLNNLVRPSDLSAVEREMLKGSLAVIRSFQQHLQRHFKLDAL
jgi:CBS domain-containing protein